MPAAVLIGGLVAIAFAFAAISAALLVRQLIVSPVRGAAAAAAEVAIVGGVIAWVLTQLANIIEIGLGGMQNLVGQAQQQAADWWNYLVNQTVWAQFNWALMAIRTYSDVWPQVSNILNLFPALWSYTLNALAPTVNATASGLSGLQAFVYGQAMPRISGIGNDLAGLHNWIDTYELPLIRGIGNDLAGLRDWVGAQAATHSEVANAQAQAIARAQAIAVPIVAAISAIEDSPCMKVCEPLGDLGQLIQGLEDAGLLAILIALVAETRTNPMAVQSALRTVVVPIVTDASGSVGIGT